MIVVADTGPINYLILIGEIEILPALFERVVIPLSVCEERKRPRAPARGADMDCSTTCLAGDSHAGSIARCGFASSRCR